MKNTKTTIKSALNLAALATLAVSVVSIAACSKPQAAVDEEVETIYAVNADVVREGNLDNYLEFGGDVSSVSDVDVLPDTGGKVSNILVTVGDMVKRWQVVAYIDPSRPGMNYAASPVRATISGRVTSIPPTIGTSVSTASTIIKIADTDELQIKINIPERFISRIQENQTAVVTFDAYPSVEFAARVFEIAPVLDTTSRTLLVKLKLEPPDERVRAGMYSRVKLVTDVVENAVVVPKDAIVYREGKPYVFVARDAGVSSGRTTTVGMVAITEGLTVDDKVEVQQGLSKGQIIVTKGQSLLSDGSKVKIIALSGKSMEGAE